MPKPSTCVFSSVVFFVGPASGKKPNLDNASVGFFFFLLAVWDRA